MIYFNVIFLKRRGMKIITYSDLHLEFGTDLKPAKDADLMILAGDICILNNFEPLDEFLQDWDKPVLYVTGNHEYYTRQPMHEYEQLFKKWLAKNHPYVTVLSDEAISIDNVNFIGGTMWTNFSNGSLDDMDFAQRSMNDFRLIRTKNDDILKPVDTIEFHNSFVDKLIKWFEKPMQGSRIVITHHAPVINPNSQYIGSKLSPAFNSLDMLEIIEKYQPDLWVYGHTHECDRQTIGKTTIISNQLGYPNPAGGYECRNFDPTGVPIIIESPSCSILQACKKL